MDDFGLSFHIDAGAFRGRMARLDATVTRVLAGHGYPHELSLQLAEALVLAALLAGNLKYDGVFTLQTKGDGPVSMMVVDVTSQGHVRACAGHDEEAFATALKKLEKAGVTPSLPHLLGAGHLAFTVDQGAHTERYQGIVELLGMNMTQCVQRYFNMSEQIETSFRLAIQPDGEGWRAAGIMLQRLPTQGGGPILLAEDADEAWRTGTILLASAKDEELLSLELPAEHLLTRLFHGEALSVGPRHPLEARCRCSAEKVANTLKSFPRAEVESMKDNGLVSVICQFCKTSYDFSDSALDDLYGS
ncbi:MAG: hypothetical protein A2516_08090 [Alphaproteobacteria bacterium RIFOXYD12_FULL_60_8]|nr:MAG: hypothetical protein A2516_08090 [Alphaproteobacteria bacterium RIFOXYD12_FULL_60_8]